MTLKLNLPMISATISPAIAGVIGTVLTPILGPSSSLPHYLQGILLGISGLLVAIGGGAATIVASSNAMATNKANISKPVV